MASRGPKICGDLEIVRKVGQGINTIFLVRRSEEFVLKNFKIEKGEINGTGFVEIDILTRVHHPNVLGSHEIYSSGGGAGPLRLCILLEVAMGDLKNYVKGLPPPDGTLDYRKTSIMHNILCGLKYLHDNFILHRDMKAANVLLFEDPTSAYPVAKIADFGLSLIFANRPVVYNPKKQKLYTIYWRPPELLAADILDVDTDYGPSADIWATGIVFCELFGLTVGYDTKEEDVLRLIGIRFGPLTPSQSSIFGKPSFGKTNKDYFDEVHADYISIIADEMLLTDPKDRKTADQLLNNKLFASFKGRCPSLRIEYPPEDINLQPDELEFRNLVATKILSQTQLSSHILFLAVDILDRYSSLQGEYSYIDDYKTVEESSLDYEIRSRAFVYLFTSRQLYFDYRGIEDMLNIEYDDVESSLFKMQISILETLNFRLFRPTLDILFPDVDIGKLRECYKTNVTQDQVVVCIKK